jgi:hypothetical protein
MYHEDQWIQPRFPVQESQKISYVCWLTLTLTLTIIPMLAQAHTTSLVTVHTGATFLSAVTTPRWIQIELPLHPAGGLLRVVYGMSSYPPDS